MYAINQKESGKKKEEEINKESDIYESNQSMDIEVSL